MPLPRPGEMFSHFRILETAGEGGMGVVLHAEDTRLHRSVALKFLTAIRSLAPGAEERMRLEARSLAALNHPNIVTLYDIEELEGSPVLVMEWVPGTPLNRARLKRPCGEADFLAIAVPIGEALAVAHTRGIIHRDIKPGNVLLTEDGQVKLVDFGLARLRDPHAEPTHTGAVAGTPAYMSPEQASGGAVEAPSDIFSFGVLAYELLTGDAPFRGDSYPSLLYSIVHTPHVPLATRRPDLSAELISLVERCLAKRPEDRFGSGSELAAEAHRAQRTMTTAVTRSLAPAPVESPVRPVAASGIRYCHTSDGASIAYSSIGSGPVIVRVLGWVTHLEIEWEWPALRKIWERLARSFTVLRYDGRGIGLSSAWNQPFSESTRQRDLEAVVDAIGAERVILYGVSEGVWTAAHYAAAHPERVSHLVLYGGYSRGIRHRGMDFDEDELKALLTLMRMGWGRDTPEYRQIFTTAYFGEDADPGLIAHFNRLQRAATDGDTAARYQESLFDRGDATAVYSSIRVPTLVIHCREDQIVPFEESRRIAALVPGAEFLPLPTGSHYFPVEDHVTESIASAIERAVQGHP